MFANNIENLHCKLLHIMIICVETKRKTAYLCFLYFREWGDPIQNRRRERSLTSLIAACFKFKFKHPASLNPRVTTILHLCAIEVVLKLSTKLCGITSGSHITSILQKKALFQTSNGVNSRFYLSKTLKKHHTFVSFQNGRHEVTLTRTPLIKSAASSRFQSP